jgi:hypothetical protein
MGSNWAEEFRQRIEESEGKYRPADNLDDMDEEEWEEKGGEEDAELEEPEAEAEEETEEVEPGEEGEKEAKEVEQEVEKPEIEKPVSTPVEASKVSLERQGFRQELDRILGNTTIQPAKTEVTKVEPVKAVKRETNDLAVAGAATIGLMMLSLMPTFYQAMTQAFQPLIQSFQNLSGRNQGTLAASQEWVACPYCGYQCLGYNGMPCPRCGRS